jgi:Fic family protein
VITHSGEIFDYASPEETSALMSDLINWYHEEEKRGDLSVIELATLFHYRYIRIHPFEDGNGRIARLLMNYIFFKHNYPMIVIPTADRNNYLDILGKCDKNTGIIPFDGANALKEQIAPFIEYITEIVEKKLSLVVSFAKGDVITFSEGDVAERVPEKISDNQKQSKTIHANDPNNVPENFAKKRQKLIVNFLKMNNKASSTEIADLLEVSPKTVKRDFLQLKKEGLIKRIGGDRGGYWEVG